MLGCYDFCGYYEWTFGWIERRGGRGALADYWAQAISRDSNRDLAESFRKEGIQAMARYWGHTLEEESPSQGYVISHTADTFRIDMHDCPSKGFLLRNGLENYSDYCDHCIGWIGVTMKDAGYVIDHAHNHRGQCWWVMHRKGTSLPHAAHGSHDVRDLPAWDDGSTPIDEFINANTRDDKSPSST